MKRLLHADNWSRCHGSGSNVSKKMRNLRQSRKIRVRRKKARDGVGRTSRSLNIPAQVCTCGGSVFHEENGQ